MKWRRTLSRNKHGYCSISVPEQIAHELGVPKNGMPADLEDRRWQADHHPNYGGDINGTEQK